MNSRKWGLIGRILAAIAVLGLLGVQGAVQTPDPIIFDSPNPQAGGWFGWAIALGDVNGDGRADIVVGAHGEDVGATAAQGRVYVFDGLTQAVIHTLTIPGLPSCGDLGCRFGGAVSAGDITGDERADIIVGAPSENVGANTTQGRAYVFDGATGALIFTLNTPNPHLAARFGISVAAGDVNGDGFTDVIVGGFGQCVMIPPLTCAGQAFVFDGATGRLIYTLNTPNPESTGLFGESVASGDVNGDGRAEIFVGAPGEDVLGNVDQGRVYVFDGATGALLLTLTAPGSPVCNLGHPYCQFGSSVSAADIDGDRRADVLIGAPLEDIGGVADQGKVYVFSAWSGALLHTLTTPNPESACPLEHECNRFGVAVGGGDVNADGSSDIIVGANAETIGGTHYQGRVYVFNGSDGALLWTIDSPSPVEPNEVLFGSAVGAGDVNGDGNEDVIVGAFRDDVDGVIEQGRVYLFLMGAPEVGPDLIVSINGPSEAVAGQDISHLIQLHVQNIGTAPAAGTLDYPTNGYMVDVVLSSDDIIPVRFATYSPNFHEDVLLKGGRVSRTRTLEAEEEYNYSDQVRAVIPTDTPPGVYCLGAVVDPGRVIAEVDETNNTACHRIRITGPLPTCPLTIEEAIDTNHNNFLEDDEILRAINFWITQEEVPGTCQTISDEKMLELINLWISGQPISSASAQSGPLIGRKLSQN